MCTWRTRGGGGAKGLWCTASATPAAMQRCLGPHKGAVVWIWNILQRSMCSRLAHEFLVLFQGGGNFKRQGLLSESSLGSMPVDGC